MIWGNKKKKVKGTRKPARTKRSLQVAYASMVAHRQQFPKLIDKREGRFSVLNATKKKHARPPALIVFHPIIIHPHQQHTKEREIDFFRLFENSNPSCTRAAAAQAGCCQKALFGVSDFPVCISMLSYRCRVIWCAGLYGTAQKHAFKFDRRYL